MRVNGSVTPVAEKRDPAMDTPEMVTGAVPVELKVRGAVPVFPTVTLPKLILVALTLNVGFLETEWGAQYPATDMQIANTSRIPARNPRISRICWLSCSSFWFDAW